jgi:hypothetical protein
VPATKFRKTPKAVPRSLGIPSTASASASIAEREFHTPARLPAGGTFTYTLVPGSGATDNASFTIDGSTLKTAASFNFATKSSYSVRIRTTDQGGLTFGKTFMITVTTVNNAPTINTAARLVSGVVNTPYEMMYETLRTTLNVADADSSTPSIVIQSINSGSLEKWNGTGWVNVSTDATAASAQRSLSVGHKIRWLPPTGLSGDRLAFKVKAWDGSMYSVNTAQVTINLATA